MGHDGAGTPTALKALRGELVKPKERRYQGRTVKLMSGGALMEFASVVDAVAFAVEVQVPMAERNAKVSEEPAKTRSPTLGRLATFLSYRVFHDQYHECDHKRQHRAHQEGIEIGQRRCLLLPEI